VPRMEDKIKGFPGIGMGDIDWIHLAHNRNRWRVPVHAVMILLVP
jgi:hypothetical protein